MRNLSAVIIVRNEEHNIAQCLEALKFASEIIVVDCGSEDRTVEIAKGFTDRVEFKEWQGFKKQKEYALSLASHEWVLSLDADEFVSQELAEEIVALSGDAPEAGLYLRRDLKFMGRVLKHGGTYPDYILRLFDKSKVKIEGSDTHPFFSVSGPTRKLVHPVIHVSYRDLTDYMERFNRYTSLAAEERQEKGVRYSPIQALRVPFEFTWRYFIRLGFLDGYPGFVYALLSSFYAFMKYAKLKELSEFSHQE